MLSFRPVWTRLRSRTLRRRLIDEADAMIEVAPAIRRDFAPIVALPDELDRITAFREISAEEARHVLTGRGVAASATRLFAIDDAIIADGCVLSSRNLDVLRPGPRRKLLTGDPERVGEALLCSSYHTERYFYHWAFDGWQREMLGRDRGLRSLWLDRTPWTHEAGYRAMIGSPRDAVGFARVGRLWIAEDGGVTAARADRLRDLRARVRAGRRPTGAQRVFIRRGRASIGRGLLNEDAVVAALEACGFTILAPEDEPPHRIADTLHDARIVVTMEGSAAVHAIMAAPDDAGLVLMQPPAAFNVLLRDHLGALGQRCGVTVGDPAGGDDIHQPIDRLLRTIDLMAAVVD